VNFFPSAEVLKFVYLNRGGELKFKRMKPRSKYNTGTWWFQQQAAGWQLADGAAKSKSDVGSFTHPYYYY